MAFAGTERFALRQQLGRGGMGVVYEAYDHVRGMRVAIKTLRRLDANALLRFKREFRALSNLSHPNIVQLYELVSEGHDWFFTMEFIDGQDLVSHVRGRALPVAGTPGEPGKEPAGGEGADLGPLGAVGAWTTLINPTLVDQGTQTVPVPPLGLLEGGVVGRRGEDRGRGGDDDEDRPVLGALLDQARLWDALGQLAGALHALHEAGMVHCDLKPSNVMVTGEGRVVLMDFGVVSAARWARRWSHDLVRVSQAEGTPAFMAPEQARGEDPGAAADWYAFGTTLYLLLAGRLPFESDAMQILLDKQEIDPLPPSIFTGGIPPALENLCMGLLARDPDARPRGEEVLATLGVRLPAGRARQRASTLMPSESDLFVGRTRELALLRRSYRMVCAGQVRWVLVDGLSGMGKSSLVGHFLHELRAAETPPLVLMGRCRERESLVYKAFDGPIDQLSLHLQEMPRRRRQAVLPEGAALLARLFPVLRRVKELDVTTHVAGGMELRRQAVRLLRGLLGALAREQPIVACIDDLQWADPDSFELLRGLLEAPAPGGLLLVATMRAESLRASENPLLEQLMSALAADTAGYRITLGPLSAAEQRALVARIGARGLGASAAEALVQESAGHPMLLAELARYAEDDAGEPAAAGALHLDDVIWRRVTRLPAAARALVEAVAVAAEPTPLGVLAAAAGLSPVDRERALSAARGGHMVRVTRTGTEPWLDAYHDKVREAVAERLPAEQVRALHGGLARALGDRDQAPIASLARHWLAAGDPDRAAEYFLRAAHGAAEQLAFDRAASLYRSVVELLADRPGNPTRDRHLCQAWLGQAQGLRLADRTDEALAVLERAQAVAAAHQWIEELAEIHYLHGNLLYPRSDLEGCLAQHAQARAYARQSGSPRREAAALGGLGDAYYMRGQIAAAHEHYAGCIELCRKHGFEDIEAANLPMRGLMRFYQNDFEAALRDGARAASLAARIGHTRAELIAFVVCLGRVWGELGWVESARTGLARARMLARRLDARRLETASVLFLARNLALRGHDDEAAALFDEIMRARPPGARRDMTEVLAPGVRALLARDRAAREEALAEVEDVIAGGGSSATILFLHRDAIEVSLALGDWDRVEHHARALEDYNRTEALPWSRFFIERARVLAACGRGVRDPETMAAVQRLFREACRVGFHVAAEALGQALASDVSGKTRGMRLGGHG